MQLVEIFLPLDRGDGSSVARRRIEEIVENLADSFGGATAFLRSPARGLWKDAGDVAEDRIVIVEVMVEAVDTNWWLSYRRRLEEDFVQQEILIRATECRRL